MQQKNNNLYNVIENFYFEFHDVKLKVVSYGARHILHIVYTEQTIPTFPKSSINFLHCELCQ